MSPNGRGRRSAPASVSTGARRGARARPDLGPTDGLLGRNLAQLRDKVRAEMEQLEIRRRQLNEEFEQMQRAAELAAVEVQRAAAEAADHEAALREAATRRVAAEAADCEAAAREEGTRRAAAEAADREAAAREEAALQVVGRQNQEPNNNHQGGAVPVTAEQFEKLKRGNKILTHNNKTLKEKLGNVNYYVKQLENEKKELMNRNDKNWPYRRANRY